MSVLVGKDSLSSLLPSTLFIVLIRQTLVSVFLLGTRSHTSQFLQQLLSMIKNHICITKAEHMFSIASGLQLQIRYPSLFLHFFFFKCWYVMFLLAVYSSSNSLRTLMLKETSRHFSFSVFLFCSCILPVLLGGEVLTVYLKSISFRFKLPLLLTRRKMETFASCYKQV